MFVGADLLKFATVGPASDSTWRGWVIESATSIPGGDGSGHWVVNAHRFPLSDQMTATFTIDSTPTGLLTHMGSVMHTSLVGPFTEDATVSYAVPTVYVPTARESVSLVVFNIAIEAVQLPGTILDMAQQTARGAVVNAAWEGRHRVWFKDIRAAAKDAVNSQYGLVIHIKWKKSSRGALLYATNPYTHKVVSYSVNERNGKAVVKRVS